MGNVQQSYSSPFIFRPCDIPAKPFAAEKKDRLGVVSKLLSQKSRTSKIGEKRKNRRLHRRFYPPPGATDSFDRVRRAT